MSDVDFAKNPVWKILVETAHSLLMYDRHKNYVKNVILREKPKIDAEELRYRLGISLGEALVILYELNASSKMEDDSTEKK